jgi:DegV family protein with EDD domain
LLERCHIEVVPALVHIGQKTLRDGVDMTREAFYDLMPSLPESPTTSAPSPAAFIEAYEKALQRANQIVSIHAAGKLSGIYNAARLAARQIAPDRIHLLDSGSLSMGLGWSVLAAAEAARSETLEAVLNSARSAVERLKLYALLNTVEYLARSGRVNMVQAGLSNLLSIKPIVEIKDGVVSTAARVRTWSRAMNTLADKVREMAPLERLAVMHSNCIDCAHDLIDRVKDVIPNSEDVLVTSTTTAIGTHTGPHAVGFAAISRR